MFEAFLATTSSEGLQPLGAAAQRSYELVSGTVAARLGPEHAALFAEPVAAEHGESIDWHAALPGRAVRMSALDAQEQAGLRAELGRLVGDIKAEAERLGEDGTTEHLRLSEALLNAIEVPGEEMIYALRHEDGRLSPVLVHWGWIRDEQAAVRGVLTGMIPRPQAAHLAAAPVAAPGAMQRRIWPGWLLLVLGWLLLLVLLGWILYLMIAPCGLRHGRVVFCADPGPQVSALLAERAVIEDAIATLERELALADRLCQPRVPVAPVSAPPSEPGPEDKAEADPPAPPGDVGRRLDERGASRGALNFALAWGSRDDIDLYVTCPAGETISYRNRQACGGVYDLDANVVNRTAIVDPVENVVFDTLVPGLYKVRAHLRRDRGAGAKPITLHVLRRDGPSQSYTGTVEDGQREWTMNISISR